MRHSTSLDERRRRWSAQSGLLALMDDTALRRLGDRRPIDKWGLTSTATLPDGSAVFLKRLPLTQLECDRPHSTRNHFRLPAFYQYGIGSAGFGAWRELATHVKTTGWVLDGSCVGVPLLLHHRVMPAAGAESRRGSGSDGWVGSPDYIRYWNGSQRIASFIDARQRAPAELWLVLEHVRERMFDWLFAHQDQVGSFVDELLGTIAFLHDRGVFHFDAHYGNVVTDGSGPLLTDFGLATDRAFELSGAERDFIEGHQHYDFGEAIWSLGNALLGSLGGQPADEQRSLLAQFGYDAPLDHDELVDALTTNVDALPWVSAAYAELVVRYRPVILFMNRFYSDLRANRRKNTPFDDAGLARLLADAGVVLV